MLLIHHWHPLCSTAYPFTPSKCWDTPEPHCSLLLSSIYLQLLPISISGKASDIVPVTFTNNIIVFSPYSTQGMSFGFRAVGSMASSWFWPSEAESAVRTHLLLLGVTCFHVQEKTQKVIQSCFGWCTLHFQPCTQFRQNESKLDSSITGMFKPVQKFCCHSASF